MNKIEFEPIHTKAQWEHYFGLCRRLYANDPAWIEPLHHSTKARWSPKNPWFEHATAKAWLAFCDGEAVGSIAAGLDARARDENGNPVGYFGQFECVEDPGIAKRLVDQAMGWLAGRGASLMRGPFDLHINDSCGLLVEGFDSPPMMLMPHQRPYYDALLTETDLEPVMRLFAYMIEPDFQAPKAMARLATRHAKNLTLRRLDGRHYSQEIRLLRNLFNDAWQDNWGFVPFSETEFDAIGQELRPILVSDYTSIAMVDDKPAGFLIALPNINELIADFNGRLLPINWLKLLWRLKRRTNRSARVPLMGVGSTYHQTPLGALIAFSMIDAVRWPLHNNGIKRVEMSWILETNQGMNRLIEAMGGRRYKTYQMYEAKVKTP